MKSMAQFFNLAAWPNPHAADLNDDHHEKPCRDQDGLMNNSFQIVKNKVVKHYFIFLSGPEDLIED
jgi:hypothetical protein